MQRSAPKASTHASTHGRTSSIFGSGCDAPTTVEILQATFGRRDSHRIAALHAAYSSGVRSSGRQPWLSRIVTAGHRDARSSTTAKSSW
jgi:hypothetical protein